MEEKTQETAMDIPSMITDSAEDYLMVTEQGRRYKTTFTRKFENRVPWTPPNPEEVKSIIPGTVHRISIQAGDYVCQNDELLVFEAMKMYNVIRAPFNGMVHEIRVKEGDHLPKGAVMLVIRPTNETPKDIKKRVRIQQTAVKKSKGKKRKA
ncbi:MAG: acetyl-CoA carboxylase biotin carboxyl carrier protein subunit [Prevotellaceae bacterium]|jgi:biotin carboxyl carrier protein|nr:acetyl-CoA carboxylase biotin carboxyl carrier protein subunit [Prevotellaceae bacterium]